MSGWVRLFYRNDTQAVFREGADLERALRRKVPGIIHQEIAIVHRCGQCGTEGPWTKEWMAYPIWDAISRHHPRPTAEVIYCSRKCWVDDTGGFELPRWIDTNQEPNRDRARMQAWWESNRIERDRKSDLVAHRRVPLPPHHGRGWCRWCAKRITSGRRYNWHDDCLRQFLLHSDLNAQLKFLFARDGRTCAIEGCDRPGAEVDHRIPLWSIRDLPEWARIPYYGPMNIWLLCWECHKAKSAREAAQRAAQRRDDIPAPDVGLFPE